MHEKKTHSKTTYLPNTRRTTTKTTKSIVAENKIQNKMKNILDNNNNYPLYRVKNSFFYFSVFSSE